MPSSWGHRQQYGEFRIVGAAEGHPKLLGEGSFGKTFEAVRSETVAGSVIEEPVALKVLNPDLLNSASKRFQFVQERTALARLKHANLIHSIKCGEDDGEVYFAMELCMGGDLTKLVKRFGAIPERVAALIGLQAAAGLREMHRREMVHRDIKPQNIMIFEQLSQNCTLDELTLLLEDNESLCRIVDFGLVGTILNAQDPSNQAAHQKFVGSMMYASPEQILERKNIDGRADVYALGMTLWYLVQGRGPLLDARGDELKHATEAEGRHLTQKPHDADLPNNLSHEFRGILAQMVAKKPEDRFTSARDLEAALERYIDRSARARSTGQTLVQSRQSLRSFYHYREESMGGNRRRFAAEHCSTRQPVRLTIVEDLDDIRQIRDDFNEVVKKVNDLAQTLSQTDVPPTLLPFQEVIYAADALAYAEEMPGDVTLAEVLQARTAAKRLFTFREAEVIFRPIAEALDHLINHGWDLVSLPCEEVWLADAATARAPRDSKVWCRPLDQWAGLRVTFSGMFVPPRRAAATGANLSFASTSQGGSSFISAESLRPPVSAFLRLVYRTLSGSDLPDAADRWREGYISSPSLQNASNNLIRDLLCKQREWSAVSLILNELCANEGVSVDAPLIPGTGADGRSTRSRPGTSRQVAAGSSTTAPLGAVPPPLPVVSTPAPAIPAEAPKQSSSASSSKPSAPDADHPTPREAREAESCEVISLGVVRLGDNILELTPLEWATREFIRCKETGRWFFFPPEDREMFPGRVERLKHVVSPYSGMEQEVDWKDWSEGKEIKCKKTDHLFKLPKGLPLPVGALPPSGRSGQVVSFFDPQGPLISVNPADWNPEGRITCPRTGNVFVLPSGLPPLEAVVELRKTGWVSSPYAPDAPWTIPPSDWFAGREITCNVTRKPLVLPPEVEQWVAEISVIDATTREVTSPYHKDARCVVPAMEWRRGGSVKCPPSGRLARLPMDLPLLFGQVIPGVAGVIRSPFTQEEIKVPLPNWITGREIVCAKSGQPFLLPPALPVPDGSLMKGKPGVAFSPYDPTRAVKVEPLHWVPGEVLTCPGTGERFKLPDKLPPLHAIVTPGDPGLVCSPFAPDATDENDVAFEFRVPIDDWVAGNEFECPVTRHVFVLPPDLEEWIQDGTWVPGSPGRLRSPFRNGSIVDLGEQDWKPGARVVCSKARRLFCVPRGGELPPLALEKAAVKFAYAEPESDEKAAAAVLKKAHREATEAVIAAIWARHQLETVDKRMPKELGTLTKGEPGFVISPYNQKKMAVPPEVWMQTGASLLCETGKRFLLPPDRPHLTGVVDPKQPGRVTSPFAKDRPPLVVKPWLWVAGGDVICEHSGHVFSLPDPLTAFVPEAALDPRKPGCVINPFSPAGESLPVRGQDWVPENILPAGGRQFKLPKELPPLVASLEKAVRGKVESPYAPGTSIPVKPDLWVPGGEVVCTKTKRKFLLPEMLPEDAFEGIDPHEDGTIQSPYGKGARFSVLALEWLDEGIVICPETSKRVILPKNLPLLNGAVDADHPCEVRSPFDPDHPMTLSADDWLEGREVTCGKTGRSFRLPKTPLPLPFAELAVGKPGAVHSPFRNRSEILVPPLQWVEGGEVEDRSARRRFRLPLSELPLLEGTPVTGRSLHVKSPFDPKAEVAVPFDDWTAGHEVICPTTKRRFALPDHLPEPVLLAKLMEDRPGWIVDPYTGSELEVPGADWNDGAVILSPEGRKVVLPGKLPPLLALVVDEASCLIRSPYDQDVLETVPAKKWAAGNTVKCGKRQVRLPEGLAQIAPPPPPQPPWAAIAAVLLVVGGAAAYFYLPRDQGKTSGGSTSSGQQVAPPVPTPPVTPDGPAKVVDVTKPADNPPIPTPPPPAPTLAEQFAAESRAGKISRELYDKIMAQPDALKPGTEAGKLAAAAITTASKQPDLQARALLDFARQKSVGGEVGEEALSAYLAAYQDSGKDVLDWLVTNTPKLPVQLFEKACKAVNAPDRARLISAAKDGESANKPVAAAAWYLEAQAMKEAKGQTAPEVLRAYREAASRDHAESASWLLSNVIAKPVPDVPLKVRDPFSDDGRTLDIPPAQWKPGAAIKERFFKLADQLHPLVAKYDASQKHRIPADAARGIIGDPYAAPNGAIEVDRKDWFRGSLLMPENILLPEDLPLMVATVDDRIMNWIAERKTAFVTSPLTGAELPIAWDQWKPGAVIKEKIKINGAEIEKEVAEMPADIAGKDPKLAADAGTASFRRAGTATEDRRFEYSINSPYTGKPVIVPVSEWVRGGLAADPALKQNGVQVSMKLPEKGREVFGWVSKAGATFSYQDEAGQKDVPLPKGIKAEELIKTGFADEETGVVFRLDGKPRIFRNKNNDYVNPLTGEHYNLQELASLSKDPLNPYGFETDVQEAVSKYREMPKVTNEPKDPPEKTESEKSSVAMKERADSPLEKKDSGESSKSRTAKADARTGSDSPSSSKSKSTVAKQDTPPPSTSTKTTAPKASSSEPASAVDSRYAKSFVAPMNGISFRYKNGTWNASKGAVMPGGDPGDFAKRLEGNLKSSGKIPRSATVTVNSDGSVTIR